MSMTNHPVNSAVRQHNSREAVPGDLGTATTPTVDVRPVDAEDQAEQNTAAKFTRFMPRFSDGSAGKLDPPRSDALVWRSVGLNVDTSDGISKAEEKELKQFGASQPAEYNRRIREDSFNGTPIEFHEISTEPFGIVISRQSI